MNPFFPLQQWHHAAPVPTGWPADMPHPWFPYGGMPPFADLGMQHPQPQQQPIMQQQQQQPQLLELLELQPLQPLQALTNHPHHHNYHHPTPDGCVPAPGSENALPPPPSVSSSYAHSPFVFPPQQQQQQINKPAEACFPTPPSDAAPAADRPPSLVDETTAAEAAGVVEGAESSLSMKEHPSGPPALAKEETQGEKTQQKSRGQKRKRSGGKDDGDTTLDSTPSDDLASPPKAAMIDHHLMNNFWKVTGRLSVVGAQRTYAVSCEEIFRRTTEPECLNRSHIGPLLRRGKVKGCGDELQFLLEKRGLSSTSHINRKRHPLSTLSALLEEEAIRFNEDHRDLLHAHFPLLALSRMATRKMDNPRDLMNLIEEAKLAKSAAEHLEQLVQGWTEGGGETEVTTVLASPLVKLALCTHILGTEELILMTRLFSRFCSTLLHEATAQMERAHLAAQTHPYAMLMNQYPPTMEWADMPQGPLVHKPDAAEEAQGSRCFAEIPGRLTLTNKKYTVTVAEIYRRVRAPESLNLSILGSQLRKGKTKDNGNSLRDELANEGIKIDQGRRKSAKITLFTALLEDESLTLARDVSDAVTNCNLLETIRDFLVAGVSTPQAIVQRQNAFASASRVAASIADLILALRLPVAERHPHQIDERAYTIFNYCSLTHGYGPDACLHWMTTFRKLFDLSYRSLPQIQM